MRFAPRDKKRFVDYFFEPPLPASIPVAQDTSRFPVRRIYCVGRNYVEHAREMGADPDTEPPFFFSKPADALVPGGGPIPYPPLTERLDHEIELVAAIGRTADHIDEVRARDCIVGYAVGIDLTRRDVQARAKERNQPWDLSKGFDHSAPISMMRPAGLIGHPSHGRIELSVNGDIRQSADLAEMRLSPAALIAELSKQITLKPGDLLFTGTPSGVGPLNRGDHAVAMIENIGKVAIEISSE